MHMRRLLSIIMLPIYLLATGGMAIAKHYCGGELEHVSFVGNSDCCCSDEACGDNSEASDEGCCKDEIDYLKVASDQESIQVAHLPTSDVAFCASLPNFYHSQRYPATIFTGCNAFTSRERTAIERRWPQPSLYLQFCCLKIGDIDCCA
jgi:hypothetical protein